MKLKITVIFIFFILAGISLKAQTFTVQQKKEWSREPEWIEMMAQQEVNYFEVVAAFDAFWANHEMPVEEDQILGMEKSSREDNFIKRLFRGKEKREQAMRNKYAFEVKKYKHWLITVEPYVQSDGSILSKEEQLKLRETQRSQ